MMNALTTTRGQWGLPAPQSMQEAMRMADMLANSTMVPRSYQGKPGDVLIAIQWGHELGLAPLQALQSIASINGRPSVWGDAAMALCVAHPACEYVREELTGEGEAMAAICRAKRKGQAEQIRRFSVADAKRAKLWGKTGPWTDYPQRMLQMRARGFALRDVFPDALRGVITAEEAQDMPADAPSVVGLAVPDATALPAPVHPMNNPNTMQSQGLALLDDALAAFGHMDDIKGYLAEPKVQRARQRAIEAGKGDAFAEIVQRHFDRVNPPEPGAIEPEETEQ